jgi:hypothetical protein
MFFYESCVERFERFSKPEADHCCVLHLPRLFDLNTLYPVDVLGLVRHAPDIEDTYPLNAL